jgi:hypothetical protein
MNHSIAIFSIFLFLGLMQKNYIEEENKAINEIFLELVGTEWYTKNSTSYFLPPDFILNRFFNNPRVLNWADSAFYPFPFKEKYMQVLNESITLRDFHSDYEKFLSLYSTEIDSSRLIIHIPDSLFSLKSKQTKDLVKNLIPEDSPYKEILLNIDKENNENRIFPKISVKNSGRYILSNNKYNPSTDSIPDYRNIAYNSRYDNPVPKPILKNSESNEKHIGIVVFSRVYFDQYHTKGILTFSFYVHELWSHKELVLIDKKNGLWIIHNRYILWIS